MDRRTRAGRLIDQAAIFLGRAPSSLWTIFGSSRPQWMRFMGGTRNMPSDVEAAPALFVRRCEARFVPAATGGSG